jgi:hypothetical protein
MIALRPLGRGGVVRNRWLDVLPEISFVIALIVTVLSIIMHQQ